MFTQQQLLTSSVLAEKELELMQALSSTCARELGLSVERVQEALPVSKLDSVKRLVDGFIREQLLDRDTAQASAGNFLNKRTADPIAYARTVAQTFAEDIKSESWLRFEEEIINSTTNNALAIAYRQMWQQDISRQAHESNYSTFWRWVEDGHGGADTALFFEQWGAAGHPHHPAVKTKLGFSTEDVLSYSPEFKGRVDIQLIAVHKSLMHVESQWSAFDANEFLASTFPEAMLSWQLALSRFGKNARDYVAVPAHPWQVEHVLPSLFADELSKLEIIVPSFAVVSSFATLSFRTVVPNGPSNTAGKPHVKIPVAVQATSSMRTVTPASACNGPRISKLLSEILAKENYFSGRLEILPEFVGMYFQSESEEKCKNISAIFRANPMNIVAKDELPIVVAALFQKSPVTQVPFFIELMTSAGVKNIDDARLYFRHYADTVLHSYLDLYLRYGIALDGHQQNTIAVFNHGRCVRFIARDLCALRLHTPTINARGYSIDLHPNSVTVTNDLSEARRKLLYTVYQMHLGELAKLTAAHFSVDEKLFWQEIAAATDARFSDLRDVIPDDFWKHEHHAIFKSDWQVKALVRMRLANTSHHYLNVSMPNPL